jgi:nucleoid DNA-binding protein
MQALITSYLIQKKECNLPLLGHFRIKTKPAEFDKAGRQIFPPTDEILFSEFAANLSAELITYICNHQNMTPEEAIGKINSWCHYAKEKLESGEKIIFNSIGSLQKDAVGNIFFQRKKGTGFYAPVPAEQVLHKNAEDVVLAGDNETASGVMNELYREEIIQKAWWKIWAVVLAALSLLVLLFYFYTHKFSETGIGNQASFPIQDSSVLHSSP